MANEEQLTIEEMVADIQKFYSKRLSEWEQSFIANLQDMIDEGMQEFLTDSQRYKLAEIYDKFDLE